MPSKHPFVRAGLGALAVAALIAAGSAAYAGVAGGDYRSGPPPQAQERGNYDYPTYGPGVTGSSLSFVVGQHSRDDLRPPPHAD
jgi:hypothetical protein